MLLLTSMYFDHVVHVVEHMEYMLTDTMLLWHAARLQLGNDPDLTTSHRVGEYGSQQVRSPTTVKPGDGV